ncbi:MAG TPA: hypothetical protein VF397_09625 [Pyrinomonadaceae bacterium]
MQDGLERVAFVWESGRVSRSDGVSLAGAFKPWIVSVKEMVVALATIEWADRLVNIRSRGHLSPAKAGSRIF